MQRFKLIPEAHIVLIREDQVFLLRRQNTGFADGKYALVAGHIDGREPARAAACREAEEEAGITILPDQLSFAHVVHYYLGDIEPDADERVAFVFRAEHWQGEPHNAEPEKCDDARWFSLAALPENMAPYARVILTAALGPEYYSEWSWDQVTLSEGFPERLS